MTDGELADTGAAGLVIELVRRFHRPPEPLVRACRRRGLPLVTLFKDVNFVDVTQVVHALILGNQAAALHRTQQIHEALTALTLRGACAEDVLRAAAEMSGRTVVLENLVHQAVTCEPAGGSVERALDAWEGRSRAAPRCDAPSVQGPRAGWWLLSSTRANGGVASSCSRRGEPSGPRTAASSPSWWTPRPTRRRESREPAGPGAAGDPRRRARGRARPRTHRSAAGPAPRGGLAAGRRAAGPRREGHRSPGRWSASVPTVPASPTPPAPSARDPRGGVGVARHLRQALPRAVRHRSETAAPRAARGRPGSGIRRQQIGRLLAHDARHRRPHAAATSPGRRSTSDFAPSNGYSAAISIRARNEPRCTWHSSPATSNGWALPTAAVHAGSPAHAVVENSIGASSV